MRSSPNRRTSFTIWRRLTFEQLEHRRLLARSLSFVIGGGPGGILQAAMDGRDLNLSRVAAIYRVALLPGETQPRVDQFPTVADPSKFASLIASDGFPVGTFVVYVGVDSTGFNDWAGAYHVRYDPNVLRAVSYFTELGSQAISQNLLDYRSPWIFARYVGGQVLGEAWAASEQAASLNITLPTFEPSALPLVRSATQADSYTFNLTSEAGPLGGARVTYVDPITGLTQVLVAGGGGHYFTVQGANPLRGMIALAIADYGDRVRVVDSIWRDTWAAPTTSMDVANFLERTDLPGVIQVFVIADEAGVQSWVPGALRPGAAPGMLALDQQGLHLEDTGYREPIIWVRQNSQILLDKRSQSEASVSANLTVPVAGFRSDHFTSLAQSQAVMLANSDYVSAALSAVQSQGEPFAGDGGPFGRVFDNIRQLEDTYAVLDPSELLAAIDAGIAGHDLSGVLGRYIEGKIPFAADAAKMIEDGNGFPFDDLLGDDLIVRSLFGTVKVAPAAARGLPRLTFRDVLSDDFGPALIGSYNPSPASSSDSSNNADRGVPSAPAVVTGGAQDATAAVALPSASADNTAAGKPADAGTQPPAPPIDAPQIATPNARNVSPLDRATVQDPTESVPAAAAVTTDHGDSQELNIHLDPNGVDDAPSPSPQTENDPFNPAPLPSNVGQAPGNSDNHEPQIFVAPNDPQQTSESNSTLDEWNAIGRTGLSALKQLGAIEPFKKAIGNVDLDAADDLVAQVAAYLGRYSVTQQPLSLDEWERLGQTGMRAMGLEKFGEFVGLASRELGNLAGGGRTSLNTWNSLVLAGLDAINSSAFRDFLGRADLKSFGQFVIDASRALGSGRPLTAEEWTQLGQHGLESLGIGQFGQFTQVVSQYLGTIVGSGITTALANKLAGGNPTVSTLVADVAQVVTTQFSASVVSRLGNTAAPNIAAVNPITLIPSIVDAAIGNPTNLAQVGVESFLPFVVDPNPVSFFVSVWDFITGWGDLNKQRKEARRQAAIERDKIAVEVLISNVLPFFPETSYARLLAEANADINSSDDEHRGDITYHLVQHSTAEFTTAVSEFDAIMPSDFVRPGGYAENGLDIGRQLGFSVFMSGADPVIQQITQKDESHVYFDRFGYLPDIQRDASAEFSLVSDLVYARYLAHQWQPVRSG